MESTTQHTKSTYEQNANIVIEDTTTGEGTGGGKLTLDSDVVATIAGLAARDANGIYELGRSRLISFGDSPTRGVAAEVGKVEAAFDLDVSVEYGVDIREMAAQLRKRIAEEVSKMAGRRVVEVNIHVVGIHLPDDESNKKETPRVR